MATTHHPRASLLSLPIEIRIQIYEYVVISPFRLKTKTRQNILTNDTSAILQTCQQLYEEALPTFYGTNIFSYNTLYHSVGLFNCHSHLIKRIHLECWTLKVRNRGRFAANSIRYFDRLCPSLQALTLDVCWFEPIGCDLVRTTAGLDAYEPLVCAVMEIAMKARLSITFSGVEYTGFLPIVCSFLGIGQLEDWRVSKTGPFLRYDFQPSRT